MSADPDAVPYIESSDTPVRVLLKPFTPDDLYHAVRDAITRATDAASGQTAGLIRLTLGSSGHGTLPNQIKRGDRRQPTLTRAKMERVSEVL